LAKMAALRADFLVMQRRKQEVVRTQMERHVKADWVVGAYADWESRTDAKLKTRAVQLRYDSIRAQDKAAVIARRNRLAQMLMAEEAHFQRQIDALDESPDQRRVRMETRARELRGKRENERKTYVDEQLERQWRMGCDALRNADSVNIAKACDAARGYQLDEKLQMLALERQEKDIFDNQWLNDARSKAQRELDEVARRKDMDDEQKRVLGMQMGEKQAGFEAERYEREEEAEALARQWLVEKAAQEEVEAERRRRQLSSKLELDSFNVAKRSERSRAYAVELEGDRVRLESVLGKEAEDERIEYEDKERRKVDALNYRESLKLLMEREAADEAELEVARNADLGKAWDKRVEQWGREQAAREQLLQVTLAGRQIQVDQKLRERAAYLMHLDAEKETMLLEVERINKIEQVKADNERARQKENAAFLQSQSAQRSFSRQLEVNSKILEKLSIEQAEAEYVGRVTSAMLKTRSSLLG